MEDEKYPVGYEPENVLEISVPIVGHPVLLQIVQLNGGEREVWVLDGEDPPVLLGSLSLELFEGTGLLPLMLPQQPATETTVWPEIVPARRKVADAEIDVAILVLASSGGDITLEDVLGLHLPGAAKRRRQLALARMVKSGQLLCRVPGPGGKVLWSKPQPETTETTETTEEVL